VALPIEPDATPPAGSPSNPLTDLFAPLLASSRA
jgi:hypothetical protein